MLATMKHSTKISDSANIIAQNLLAIHSVQFNVKEPFTWVSGIKSPVYCDNRKINSDVAVRNIAVDAFVKLIKDRFNDVEIIAGVATGGIPLGILIADRLNLPFIYVRQAPKEHGLKKQVEGAFKANNKVVLIEDHISTGGSSLKAIDALRANELNVLALVSVMTYGFNAATNLFSENNIEQQSLCDLDTILDVAQSIGNIDLLEKEEILKFRSSPKTWKS